MTKELAIATTRLTKQFDRHVAVCDVDLQIESGEVYGLIGPNGAGKTTLLRLLATVEEPTAGEIYLYGRPLHRREFLKPHLGYLPDDFPLYNDLTVWDYLDYFAQLYRLGRERRRRLEEVLELVQLTHKRHQLVSTLSRGMKQRLSLARTIIHAPLLLLLDEPVSGLDPLARQQFREIIRVLHEAGMTIIISSHVLSDLAQLCTTVGIMEMGYLVESTSVQSLYERSPAREIQLTTLAEVERLQQELRHHPSVKEWDVSPEGKVRVQFTGTLAESAELLRSLVAAGIPLTQFHQSPDLETIFLNLEHHQSS